MEGTTPSTESLMVLAGVENNLSERLDERVRTAKTDGDNMALGLSKNWLQRAEVALERLGVEITQLEGFEATMKKLVDLEQMELEAAKTDTRKARKFVAAQPAMTVALLALAVVGRRLSAHTLDAVVEAGLTTRDEFEQAVQDILAENPPFGE